MEALFALLSDTKEPDDKVETTVEYPRLPPGTVGYMFPCTYYHLNVKYASLWTAALLLDMLKTMGIATAFLAAHALLKTAGSQISPEEGEYSVFLQAVRRQKAGETVTVEELYRDLHMRKWLILTSNAAI